MQSMHITYLSKYVVTASTYPIDAIDRYDDTVTLRTWEYWVIEHRRYSTTSTHDAHDIHSLHEWMSMRIHYMSPSMNDAQHHSLLGYRCNRYRHALPYLNAMLMSTDIHSCNEWMSVDIRNGYVVQWAMTIAHCTTSTCTTHRYILTMQWLDVSMSVHGDQHVTSVHATCTCTCSIH